MAVKTKAQLKAQSTSTFTNAEKSITAPNHRTFNDDVLDSVQIIPVVVAANITALNDQEYINTANATYTDPTPVQGKGFTVTVRNGTATVGGVAYAIAGTVIKRIFHSGAWVSYPTFSNNVYAVGGLTVDNSNPRFPTIYPVHSFLSTAPTVDEDSSLGYLVKSKVMALDTGIEYICTDNTDAAAVWKPTSGTWSPALTFDGVFVRTGTVSRANFSLVGNTLNYSIRIAGLEYDFTSGTEGFIQIADTEFPFLPTETHIITANLYNEDVIGILAALSSSLRITMFNNVGAISGSSILSIIGQCQVTI